MTRKCFEVKILRVVILEVDDFLTPDPEWRSVFYNCGTLGELAEHIVHNVITRGSDHVEGLLPGALDTMVRFIEKEQYLEYTHKELIKDEKKEEEKCT